MNQQNVEALEALLAEHCRVAHGHECECCEGAAYLASRGVLVPGVLTEDQAVRIGADAAGTLPADPAEIALCVREGLERIARGEA
jgi:hypothetical protein